MKKLDGMILPVLVWAEDGAKMLAALNAGLSSEDHQKFVERLAAAK